MNPLIFPHSAPPAATTRITVAPGVFWLRMPLPFKLDHINLWLIEEKDGYTLVDTGIATAETQAIWETILAALDRPVKRLIVTHFHPDHFGLAAWLQEKTGASLSMTQSEYLVAHCIWNEMGGFGTRPMLEQFRAHGLDEERLQALDTRGNLYQRGVSALPQHYRRLVSGDELLIGDARWRIIIGYGHAPEHASLYCPDKNLLISGDMLLPSISTNISVFAVTPELNALKLYLDSLEDLLSLPATTLVLPSHGLPFTGIHSRIQELKKHHQDRLASLLAACTTPQTAAGVLDTLFARSLDTHQVMFAMGEAIAHLNFLEQAGQLERRTEKIGTQSIHTFQAVAA